MPLVSQHAVAQGQGVYLSRRLRVVVFSVVVLLLLTKFITGTLPDVHIDMYSDDAVDPDSGMRLVGVVLSCRA